MLSPNTGSSHTPPGFVDALVTAVDTEIITIDDLKTELADLFTRMQSNQGKEVIASTINGKYFGFQVSLSVEEKFTAFAQALRIANGDAIVCTYPDFSALQR